MKNEKIEVVNEVTEVEETEETKRNILSKPIGWVKRNGKKIVTDVAVGAGLVLAYGLGKKSAGALTTLSMRRLMTTLSTSISQRSRAKSNGVTQKGSI